MVHIEDSGSFFDAPIDKIWKLVEAHGTDLTKIHPDMKNVKAEMVSENSNVVGYDNEMQGQTIRSKIKITSYYPLGLAFEMLEGPLAGSKFFNYYIPSGNRTGITVVGEFKSSSMNDNMIRQVVKSMLDNGFDQDTAYLKLMKS
ncbi:MAG TPA: hypothetical protein VJJ01_00010 [Nitrosopumilaceae archaeon]|nr:hypothetical protein [Nitrosopumilaceae archaeon]